MKALFLICTTLLCTSVSSCYGLLDAMVFNYHHDLCGFMDWCQVFSIVYPQQEQAFLQEESEKSNTYIRKHNGIVGRPLSDFISSAVKFRNVLVRSSTNGFFNKTDLDSNLDILTTFIVTMTYVFDDLIYQISQWENDEHTLRKSLTVMDDKPLKWFKEHGFDESTLHNITVQKLKEEVQKFYGPGSPFDWLLSFFGSLHKELFNKNSSTRLAWLLKFASNAEAVGHLGDYLYGTVAEGRGNMVNKMTRLLHELGDKAGPLSKMFGNGKDDLLCPFLMPMFNRAVYFQKDSKEHWEIIKSIRTIIRDDLMRLRRSLQWHCQFNATKLYWDHGYVYNANTLDVKKLINVIASLTTDYGLITELETLMPINLWMKMVVHRSLDLYVMNFWDGPLIIGRSLVGMIANSPRKLPCFPDRIR